MYAMKILPSFKDYIWGGNRLESEFGFKSGFDKTAEAWILSSHADGDNIIENGEFKGKTLRELLMEHPDFIKKGYKGDLPVLIKFIDAKDNLSIQVHPGEEYALKNENDHGKTEAWYILDAEENAELILGFKNAISKEQLREAVENDTILDSVNRVKVKKGEIYFIPSGTLHAIGKGILICEIQQNSNVTYRLYDYGRLQNGKKRPLHIEKAIDVLDFRPYENKSSADETSDIINLVTCDIFIFNKINVKDMIIRKADSDSFISLVCAEGEGTLTVNNETYNIKKGDSYFIPAGTGEYKISGKITVFETKIP